MREGLNVLGVLDSLRAGSNRPNVPFILLHGTAFDPAQTTFRTVAQLREQMRASERLYESVVRATPHGEYRSTSDAGDVSIPFASVDAVAQSRERRD